MTLNRANCYQDVIRQASSPDDFLCNEVDIPWHRHLSSFLQRLVHNVSTLIYAMHMSLLISGVRLVFSRVMFNILRSNFEQLLPSFFKHTWEWCLRVRYRIV